MRSTLTFKIPEEHALALNGHKYACVLSEFDTYLKNLLKYKDDLSDDQRAAYQDARTELHNLASDFGLAI